MTDKQKFYVAIQPVLEIEAKNEEEALKTAESVIVDHAKTLTRQNLEIVDDSQVEELENKNEGEE